MKKFVKFLMSIGIFVILFYHQGWIPGLNLSVFCIILWGLLTYRQRKFPSKQWYLSAAVILSSVSFGWYGDFFSFGALFFSIVFFALSVQYPRLKGELFPILWILNYGTFLFRIFYFKNWLPQRLRAGNLGNGLVAYIVMPLLIGSIFTLVYTSGSDLFATFFEAFFSEFDWLVIVGLIVLGFFFMFNIWFTFIPKSIIWLNRNLTDNFSPAKSIELRPSSLFDNLKSERLSGIISLVVINVLLFFFLISYNYEQFFRLDQSGNLSQETHQRVGTVIFSIVLAIGIILYYFKSVFNFDPKAILLKRLAYIWIVLNALLILSTFLKTGDYILAYGLTFKRIGVVIFLALSLTGLFYTWLKIKLQKTNRYLIAKMTRISFGTFVVCSMINFSWVVTKYNISTQNHPDKAYLKQMDYNEILLFQTFGDNPEWRGYFSNLHYQKEERQANKPILSRHLYDYFLFQKLDGRTE